VKVLLFFLIVVAIGAMWETGKNRPQRMWPLLGLCVFIAAVFFKVARAL
jgi:hypothetical protein